MYVPINSGMGRMGMGDVMPAGSGQMVNGVYVMNTPITTDTVTSSGTNLYQDSTGAVVTAPTSPQTLTAWLNANSTMVAVGAAAFVGLLFFMRAGR